MGELNACTDICLAEKNTTPGSIGLRATTLGLIIDLKMANSEGQNKLSDTAVYT